VLLITSFLANVPVILEIFAVYQGEASEGYQMVKKQLKVRDFPTYVVSETK
jgi:hypothetical protein